MSTQIMQFVQDNKLLSEMSTEEAAILSGGAGAIPGANALAAFLAANGQADGTITPAQGVIVTAVTLA